MQTAFFSKIVRANKNWLIFSKVQ